MAPPQAVAPTHTSPLRRSCALQHCGQRLARSPERRAARAPRHARALSLRVGARGPRLSGAPRAPLGPRVGARGAPRVRCGSRRGRRRGRRSGRRVGTGRRGECLGAQAPDWPHVHHRRQFSYEHILLGHAESGYQLHLLHKRCGNKLFGQPGERICQPACASGLPAEGHDRVDEDGVVLRPCHALLTSVNSHELFADGYMRDNGHRRRVDYHLWANIGRRWRRLAWALLWPIYWPRRLLLLCRWFCPI